MISLFLGLLFFIFMLWIGFKVTGVFLTAIIWLCIKIPLALMMWMIGLICCCTLILIPVGIGLFKAGLFLMIPGCLA